MKIICVEPLGISQVRFEELKQHYASTGHEFVYYMDRREDEATLAERMHEADIAVISNIKLPATVLSQCTRLKYLSVAFTGLDHIDLAYCAEHGIKVQNAAGYSTTAVSELAVGMMLDLLRGVTTMDGVIRDGKGRGGFIFFQTGYQRHIINTDPHVRFLFHLDGHIIQDCCDVVRFPGRQNR